MSYLAGQNNFQFSIIEINIIELLQNKGISVKTIKVLRNLRIVCVCSNKGRKCNDVACDRLRKTYLSFIKKRAMQTGENTDPPT